MALQIKQARYIGTYVTTEQLPADGLPEIALVGRSNVGKSSLINRLANRRNLAKSSSTPGKTRTINFYIINEKFYMVDLPGYGFAKVGRAEKDRWGKMIESYLRHRTQLRGVIQLVDIRHPPSANDLIMKDWLQQAGIPLLVVATKADKISRGARGKSLAVVRKNMNLDLEPLYFSAQTGDGRDELLEEIDTILSGQDDGGLVT